MSLVSTVPAVLARKIEIFANVAIIVAAALLSVVLIQKYFLKKPAEPADTKSISVGQKLNVPNVSWDNSQQTVLMCLSTQCHFCTESAAFYQQLKQQHPNARFVAVFPQPVQEAGDYLKRLGLSVTEIKQASSESVGISGTPTIILANDKGIVTDLWEGKLTPERENEVLSKVLDPAS